MINGITDVAITKLDVLDQFKEIKICTGYQRDGKLLKTFPTDVRSLESITTIYENHEGWDAKTSATKGYSDLPLQARNYITAIGKLMGSNVKIISVGARRDQTIFLD